MRCKMCMMEHSEPLKLKFRFFVVFDRAIYGYP